MADAVSWGSQDFQVPEYFNFADIIDDWARKEKEGKRQSNTPALWWIDGDGNEVKWSFQDVAFNSKKTANMLCTAVDIKPGDRVMVIFPAIPEYWLVQAACLRTGGVFLVIPDNIGPKELHRRILKSKPVCVVTANSDQINKELLDLIDKIANSGDVNIRSRILVNRIKDEQREGWLSFEKLFQIAGGDFQSLKSKSSAPTNIFFSSGTTGNAKMIEHSQASMALGGLAIKKVHAETDLIWLTTPTGWSALLIQCFFGAWSDGAGAFVHYKKVTPREALNTLQEYPITKAQFRPSTYMTALKEDDLESFSFARLKCFYVAGEPSSKKMLRQWREKTGIELWDFYGQTEMNAITFLRDSGNSSLLESVGRPLQGIDLLVIDDNNQEVPYGTLGRVVVRVKPYRPVNMFTRYVDDPQKTAACFSGDFYVTGDLGKRDADGHFWIVGRVDDLINCNALLVNPLELENCLKEHPAVLECGAVSTPYLMSQAIKAFIVLSNDFKSKNQDELMKELQDHVTNNAGGWMRPEKMEFVENLPKTLTGKVNRRELKNKEWDTQ